MSNIDEFNPQYIMQHVHCNAYDGCLVVGSTKCKYDNHPVPPPSILKMDGRRKHNLKFESEQHRERWEKQQGVKSKTYHSANTMNDYQLSFENRITWKQFFFRWVLLASIILFAIYAVEWLEN